MQNQSTNKHFAGNIKNKMVKYDVDIFKPKKKRETEREKKMQ